MFAVLRTVRAKTIELPEGFWLSADRLVRIMQRLKWKRPEAISTFFPARWIETQIQKIQYAFCPVKLPALEEEVRAAPTVRFGCTARPYTFQRSFNVYASHISEFVVVQKTDCAGA